MGIKNGLKMALPCELSLPKLPNCVGEYNVTSWSNCYGERASANGGAYRGTYLEGKANGKGEFINSDGTRYLGDYLRGQRNGTGKEYSSSGVLLKQGQWNKGNFEEVSSQKANSQSSSAISASAASDGPMKKNKEYECSHLATHRTLNGKKSEMKIQAKPFYIMHQDDKLKAFYKGESASAIPSSNNAKHIWSKLIDDSGRQFNVSHFERRHGNDLEVIEVFTEPKGQKKDQLTYEEVSKSSDHPAILTSVYSCN